MRKITHDENMQRQLEKLKQPRLPFHIVLNNIRSLHNVGSIFRTCDGVGVQKLWLCGITGFPPNNQIAKTALGAEDQIDWEYREDIRPILEDLKENQFEIVALEQTDRSVLHSDYQPTSAVCLIIGNEVDGVDQDIADISDKSIEIEMAGIKNSLNVSVAFGIAAYHIRGGLQKLFA